jgi:hypothetical protein
LKAGTLSYEEAAAQSGLPTSPTFKLFNGSWPLIYASMLSDASLNPPTLIYDMRIDHFPFSCDRLDELTAVPQRQLQNIRAIYCNEPQRRR